MNCGDGSSGSTTRGPSLTAPIPLAFISSPSPTILVPATDQYHQLTSLLLITATHPETTCSHRLGPLAAGKLSKHHGLAGNLSFPLLPATTAALTAVYQRQMTLDLFFACYLQYLLSRRQFFFVYFLKFS